MTNPFKYFTKKSYPNMYEDIIVITKDKRVIKTVWYSEFYRSDIVTEMAIKWCSVKELAEVAIKTNKQGQRIPINIKNPEPCHLCGGIIIHKGGCTNEYESISNLLKNE